MFLGLSYTFFPPLLGPYLFPSSSYCCLFIYHLLFSSHIFEHHPLFPFSCLSFIFFLIFYFIFFIFLLNVLFKAFDGWMGQNPTPLLDEVKSPFFITSLSLCVFLCDYDNCLPSDCVSTPNVCQQNLRLGCVLRLLLYPNIYCLLCMILFLLLMHTLRQTHQVKWMSAKNRLRKSR